jgi:hypothetical protein
VPESAWLALGPTNPGSARALLIVVVAQALRSVEQDDPLRRADCCSAVADHLLLTMVLASERGDGGYAAELGKQLGEYMEQGVNTNLSLVRVDGPAARLAEVERVMRRAARVIEGLERNLNGPPVPARAKLRRVMQGANRARIKNLEKTLKKLEKALKKPGKDAPGKPRKGKARKAKGARGKGNGAGRGCQRRSASSRDGMT